MSAQKTPLSRTLTNFVNGMVRKEIEKLGRALPCKVVAVSGSIVTVSFQVSGVQIPQVEMPMFGPEYIRYPTQVGDLGVTFPVDTYLGQITGLGTGTASLTRRANLSTLVFFPIASKNWTATDDANSVVVYGPNGVILRDKGGNCKVTIGTANIDLNAKTNLTIEASNEVQVTVGSTSFTMTGSQIQMSAGGVTATLSASGFIVTGLVEGANLTTAGALTSATATIGGKSFLAHDHNVVGVQAGGSTITTTAPL